MTTKELHELLDRLRALQKECEYVEFKVNDCNPQNIGEDISAISNSARLHNQPVGYILFGIENNTHNRVGTSCRPKTQTVGGGEELENWIAQRLEPRIDFRIYEFQYSSLHFALFEIPATTTHPVAFKNVRYIRVGSYTRKLSEFQEKEKVIWNKAANIFFENKIAFENLSSSEVVKLLDCQAFFDLMKMPYPTNRDGVIEKLKHDELIVGKNGLFHITNLGAILFAKNLNYFSDLKKKAPRVVVYNGRDKLNIKKHQVGGMGYAIGLKRLVEFVNDQLPSSEEISGVLRQQVRVYPEIAIRELVANAIIHQDFNTSGAAPLVEIYDDRVEITNPGKPLIKPLRFIDEDQTRNEKLANLMRKMGHCEELGSGIDRVIASCEFYQLPAPEFQETDHHTRVVLFAQKKFSEMDVEDKIRACYQHCALKYVQRQNMTNASLRDRFKMEARNMTAVSKIISETMEAGFIKYDDPSNTSRRYAKYVPIWA